MSILLVGDLHGSLVDAKIAADFAVANDCIHLVQLGDWGFIWPNGGDQATPLSSYLVERGLYMDFIDGNHDWHDKLNELDYGIAAPCVEYLHRGGVVESATGVTAKCLGGAASVDKHHRKEGKSWFPTEYITEKDLREMFPHPVMLCHDSPVLPWEIPSGSGGWPADAIERTNESRAMVMRAVGIVKPKRLFHGHYHVGYGPRRYLQLPTVEVFGLANNSEKKSLLLVNDQWEPIKWGP